MDPTPKDLADTMTATLRTLKEQGAAVSSLLGLASALFILVSVFTAVGTFYLLRKTVNEWQ